MMHYYVKERTDKRAELVAADGYPLSTFENVIEAVTNCIVECRVAPLWIEWNSESANQELGQDDLRQALKSYCSYTH